MKIAILYSHLKELGGAERVILKQVELFHSKGYDAECFFAYLDKNLRKESRNPHCYTKSFFKSFIPNNPATRIILSIPLAPLALSAFTREDVLLCHGYGPGHWIGYLNKKLRNLRYISYIHSPPRFLYLDKAERGLGRFNDVRETIFRLGTMAGPMLKELDYLSVANSDLVLANSRFTAERIRNIYGVEPEVCYPPVDTDTFRILPQEAIKECKGRFGYPLILSTGRIVAMKHWEWLLEIMSHIVH